MSGTTDPDGPAVDDQTAADSVYRVDARGALGVQVGEGSTQIIYNYGGLTWTNGVAPPPLVDVSGAISSPYRGLNSFEERDAAFFFGREAAASEVLEQLSDCVDGPGVLVVSGVSGAGKSSLLQAGVIPRIRGVGLVSAPEAAWWPCLVFTPTRTPLDELAVRVASLADTDAAQVRRGLSVDPVGFALTAQQAALAARRQPVTGSEGPVPERFRRPPRLLLVIDQFEQLFTRCPDEALRQAFILALHSAATQGFGADQIPPAVIVLSVRADFEARCAEYPQLTAAVQDRYLLTSMTERQLATAIVEPARVAGSAVQQDLVDALLQEVSLRRTASSAAFASSGVSSGAGVLPLLSHALDQAWRSRTGNVLTLADYERTGGIEEAVADSAQRVYDHLTALQQAEARQVFTRLTATSSDGLDTAERAERSELVEGKTAAEAADVEAVLEAFAAQRLLVLAAGTVEISHEVLLTAWPLMRDTWLAETHADRIVRSRLRNVAGEWAHHAYDASYLYSGSLLDTALQSAGRIETDRVRHPSLSHDEREFLAASERAHRRRVRWRWSFVAALVALVVGLASVTVVARQSRQDAIRQRDVAVSQQLAALSETLGDANPPGSRVVSLAAWRIHHSSETRYAELAAAARPGIKVDDFESAVFCVAFSPDGKTQAIGHIYGTVDLWDVADGGGGVKLLEGHRNAVRSVVFSPDSKTLASAGIDGTVRLWDVATGRQLGAPLTGHTGWVYSVAFSPDGKTLASAGADKTVRLWDVATRRQLGVPMTGHTADVNWVAFSPDGKTLASASGDGTVRWWDAATRRPLGASQTGQTAEVNSVAFSPDGKTLASASGDGTVRWWDAATRRPLGASQTGHNAQTVSVAFSPDGKRLASASGDGTVRLWDVATRRQLGAGLTGHTSWVYSVAFSPDGKTLASAGVDGTVRSWDVATRGQPGASLTGHTSLVFSVAISPDGKTLASASADKTVRLWDVATHRQLGTALTGHTGWIRSVAFSPDGKTLASAGDDKTVRLWDVATHRQLGAALTGQTGGVFSVVFSPDGKRLATATADGTVQLWDVATRRQLGAPLHGGSRALAFSPDGKTLASASADGTVRSWDVVDHVDVGQYVLGHTAPVYSVVFSPDGKTLASASADATVRLWDVATGRQLGAPLTGHTGWVFSVAFSPDGKMLASASSDATVRLWDVATGRQVGAPLFGHTGWVYSVAFSPDGRRLASASSDRTVRVWDVAYVVDVTSYLCSTTKRFLARTWWERYMPHGPAYRKVCPGQK